MLEQRRQYMHSYMMPADSILCLKSSPLNWILASDCLCLMVCKESTFQSCLFYLNQCKKWPISFKPLLCHYFAYSFVVNDTLRLTFSTSSKTFTPFWNSCWHLVSNSRRNVVHLWVSLPFSIFFTFTFICENETVVSLVFTRNHLIQHKISNHREQEAV